MAGHTETEIRSLSGRRWVMVRRGAYVERELYDALEARDRDMLLRDRASHLFVERPHLMSHDSAARCWRLPMLRPEAELVHVTRLGVGGSRTIAGVKHHLTRVELLDRSRVDGMDIAGLARTALDLAREHGVEVGVMACDAVLRRGVTRRDLLENLERMWSWPGVSAARAAVDLADPGAETPGESLMRIFLHELGLGPITTQYPVVTHGRIHWADCRVGCQLFEFDGFIKLQSVELGGVAQRSAAEVVWKEKVRQDQVTSEGLGMSRVVWEEMFGAARKRARARILRENEHTLKRYGDRPPEHVARAASRLEQERARRLRVPWVDPLSTWVS